MEINPVGAAASSSVLTQLQRGEPAEEDTGRTDFLELMIAQLNNQDPLSPQENGEFLAQLAQFSSLESMRNLESSFGQLANALTSGNALQAASLVGREVLTRTDTALVDAGGIRGQIDVPSATDSVSVDIFDPNGVLVRQLTLGPHPGGELDFDWDGLNAAGKTVRPGVYRFAAQGVIDGESTALATTMPALVGSVSFGESGTILNIVGVGPTPITDIREFR